MTTKTKTIERTIYDTERARKAAIELVQILGPACHRLEIAGSLRRDNKTGVHDIDLVAWAIYDDFTAPNLFGELVKVTTGPDRLVRRIRELAPIHEPDDDAKILHFDFEAMPVEIYLSERDGSNFGALWQMRTGSRYHNSWLARVALSQGLEYRAGYGIFRADQRVDNDVECDIYHALGLSYYPPANR